MKYLSERSLAQIAAGLDHADPARRVAMGGELEARRTQPEAVMLLRVAVAREADAGARAELARLLAQAEAGCGLAREAPGSGRVLMDKLGERLAAGDASRKLRALELLVWYPEPDALPLLRARRDAEADRWVRAALDVVLAGEGEPPAPPPPEPFDEHGSVACPMCAARVSLSRQTMGDLVQCAACGMGFRLSLERRVAEGQDAWLTHAEAAPAPGGPGERVRQLYEVVGELGRGGQGAVYRVRTRALPGEFALKYNDSAEAIAGKSIVARQDVASLLDHPHIVAVYATGVETDGRPYVVYEIVEGRSLSKWIAEGPLPVEKAVAIAFQVLAGLAHSHANGVVHRDIKPDNILVAADGTAKVADFGIGIVVGHADELGTVEEPFVGTPGYAAPEQISGWGAIRASDVYAFGMTFYEMLTGRLPFVAPTLEVLLHSQVNVVPRPPSTYVPGLPPALDALVMRWLEKSPVKRPAWAGAAIEELKVAARACGFEVPLAVAADEPEPTPLLSAPGLRAGGPVVLGGALLFGMPVGVALSPAAKWLYANIEGLAAGWFVATAAFMILAHRRAGERLHVATMAGYGLERAQGAAFVLAGLATLPLLVSHMRGDLSDTISSFLPPAMLGPLGLCSPLWFAFIDAALDGPVQAQAERGLSVLELGGPSACTGALDGGAPVRLPLRALLKPGAHRVLVTGDGCTQRFTLHAGPPAILRSAIAPGRAVLEDRAAPRPRRPDDWRAALADARGWLAMLAVIAMAAASSLVVRLAMWSARAH